MNNQNNNQYPMLNQEVSNPVYLVKAATTDLLAARVADAGIIIQMKGGEHTVQAQAITHLQTGEKVRLMQCDPFPGDTHATFQTMPEDGLFPLNGVVSLKDVERVETEVDIA